MRPTLAVFVLSCSLLICTVASLPLGDQCSQSMVDNFRLAPREFAGRLLACQIRGNPDEHCCGLTRSLFTDGGLLDKCLCAPTFLSMILDSVPNAGIMPEFALNMWKQCGIPVSGEAQCPGTEEGPAVTGQGLLAKALGAKALVAKALTKPALIGGLLSQTGSEEEEYYEEPAEHSDEEYYVHEGSHVQYVHVTPAYVEVPGPPVEVPVPTPVEVPGPPVEVPVPTPVEVPGSPVEVPVPVPTPVEVPGPPVEVPVPVPTPVEVPGPPVEVPVPVETPAEVPVTTPQETPPPVPQAPLDVTVDVSTSSFIPPPGEDKLTGGMRLENGGETWNALSTAPTAHEDGNVAQGFVDTGTEQFVDTTAAQVVDTSAQQPISEVVTDAVPQPPVEAPGIVEQTPESPEVVQPAVQEVVETPEIPALVEGTDVSTEGSATATVNPATIVAEGQDASVQGAYAGRRLRFL